VYSFDADVASRFGCHVLKDYYPNIPKAVFPNVQEGIPIKSFIRTLRGMDFQEELSEAIKVEQ
jgi:hypothetical protein